MSVVNNLSFFPNQTKILNVIFDGNSITAGSGVLSNEKFSNLVFNDQHLSKLIGGIHSNIAVGGQTTINMITRQESYLYPNFISGLKNVVIAMEIRNDIHFGSDAINAYNNIKTYCQNCKDNGFDVILVNQPPSNGGTPVGRTQAQVEIERIAARDMILADFQNSTSQSLIYTPNIGITYADILCDIGGDSIMGNWNECSNLTYYQDGTHPTVTGHLLIYTIIKRAIQYYSSR